MCQACVIYHAYNGTNMLQLGFSEVVAAESRLCWTDERIVGEKVETTIEDAPLGGVCGERKETGENQRDVISREFPLLFPSFYISFLFFSFFSLFPSLPPWQGKFLEEVGKVGMDGKINPGQEEKPMIETEVWLRVEMNLVIYLFYVL